MGGTVAAHPLPTAATMGAAVDGPAAGEAGEGFVLPAPGYPRQDSLVRPAAPIPPKILSLYRAAGARYRIPTALLAGVGMIETTHGARTATSVAGARGLMQFMPATFTSYGVDGDGDGMVSITSDADSVYSAANYLSALGVHDGPGGVRRALFGYNHATWYVNDVLAYAAAYGGGTLTNTGTGNAGVECPEQPGGAPIAPGGVPDGPDGPCPPSGSRAEHALTPTALRGLRCTATAFPQLRDFEGVGERAGPTDHHDGLAIDVMIPAHATPAGRAHGWAVANWARTHATTLGVEYVIWDMKIWSTRHPRWRPYTRYGPHPDDTLAHRDHIHLSFAPTH